MENITSEVLCNFLHYDIPADFLPSRNKVTNDSATVSAHTLLKVYLCVCAREREQMCAVSE